MKWMNPNKDDYWYAEPSSTVKFCIWQSNTYYADIRCGRDQLEYLVAVDTTLEECKRICENIWKIIKHSKENILYVGVENYILQYYRGKYK